MPGPTETPPIVTRQLLLAFASAFGSATGFYLLLSAVPLYAASIGAGGTGAGLATGALMLSTVAAEPVTPRLIARFGYRTTLAAGLVLLGAPAFALGSAPTMAAVLVVCLARGAGFGITVVVGSALVAELVPPERRGEGLGLYGVVVGVPSVAALPLGVWLATSVGYAPVFVAGGLAALAALAAVPGLPGRADPDPGHGRPVGVLAGLGTPALLRPLVVFFATAMAAGIVVTFLPLALPGASGELAAFALLAQAATATLARWWAGRYGDRRGPAALLVPAVLAAGIGVLALVAIASPAAAVAGMLLFGAGFGVAQNATLSLMFERVPPSGYGTVSAMWNMAYDAGLGVGAAGFGVVAARTGYPWAFALTATLVLAALLPAWFDLRRNRTHRLPMYKLEERGHHESDPREPTR
jgi:predicted MFS family arabinose efflux permease